MSAINVPLQTSTQTLDTQNNSNYSSSHNSVVQPLVSPCGEMPSHHHTPTTTVPNNTDTNRGSNLRKDSYTQSASNQLPRRTIATRVALWKTTFKNPLFFLSVDWGSNKSRAGQAHKDKGKAPMTSPPPPLTPISPLASPSLSARVHGTSVSGQLELDRDVEKQEQRTVVKQLARNGSEYPLREEIRCCVSVTAVWMGIMLLLTLVCW
jgi:hypothetical protein